MRRSCEVSSWVMETEEGSAEGRRCWTSKGGRSTFFAESPGLLLCGQRPTRPQENSFLGGQQMAAVLPPAGRLLRAMAAKACGGCGWPAAQSFLAGCSRCSAGHALLGDRWQRRLSERRRGGGCRTWLVVPKRDRDTASGLAAPLVSAPPNTFITLLRLLHGRCHGWRVHTARPSCYQHVLVLCALRTIRQQQLVQQPSPTDFLRAPTNGCGRDGAANRPALHQGRRPRRTPLHAPRPRARETWIST